MNRENKRKQYEKGYYKTHACEETFTCRNCGRLVVPAGAVGVAGSRPMSRGPGAEQGIHLYCPVIVKYRDEKTSGSITLEDMLR